MHCFYTYIICQKKRERQRERVRKIRIQNIGVCMHEPLHGCIKNKTKTKWQQYPIAAKATSQQNKTPEKRTNHTHYLGKQTRLEIRTNTHTHIHTCIDRI